MNVLKTIWRGAMAALTIAATGGIAAAQSQDTIKIGVLHSLSGTMAISEFDLKGHRLDDGRQSEQKRRPSRQEG